MSRHSPKPKRKLWAIVVAGVVLVVLVCLLAWWLAPAPTPAARVSQAPQSTATPTQASARTTGPTPTTVFVVPPASTVTETATKTVVGAGSTRTVTAPPGTVTRTVTAPAATVTETATVTVTETNIIEVPEVIGNG